MYKDDSGDWQWEAVSPPGDQVLIPGLTGACATVDTGDRANTLICGINDGLWTSHEDSPNYMTPVGISGAPTESTPYFAYSALSLGGSGFAMVATSGRARYVLIGNLTYGGRTPFVTSTWVTYPSDIICLSMTRRTTATADWLVLGCTNSIYVIPLSDRLITSKTGSISNTAVGYPIGAGTYTAIAYSPLDDYIYLGSSAGIGFQVNAATMRISRLFFIPESSRSTITSVVVDSSSSTANIYWAAINGAIYRTTPTNFDPLDTLDLSRSLFSANLLKIAQMIPAPGESGKLLIAAASLGWTGNPSNQDTAQFIQVLKTDCSVLSCKQCVADSYCSYCYTTGSCLNSESCPATETANTTAQCPAISSTSPSRVSVTGGAYWTAYLTALKTGLEASDYRCIFSVSNATYTSTRTVIATSIDTEAVTVSCFSPQFPAEIYNYSSVYAGTAYIAYAKPNNNLVAWTPSARKFNFYNCIPRIGGCANINIDCGWCFSTAMCTSPNDTFCPAIDSSLKDTSAGFRPQALTAITSITPSVISIAYTGRITVNVTQFPVFADPNKQLLCVTNSNRTSVATPTIDPENPNFYLSFSCPLMNVPQPTTSAPRKLSFSIYTGPMRQVPLSSALAAIYVFNCAQRTNCLDCLDPALESGCSWCPTSRKCFDPSLAPNTETCTQNNATCPIITEVNPAVATLTSFNSNALQVAIHGKGFTSAPSLSCSWNLPTIGTYSSTASVANDTYATCSSQGPVSVPEIWNFGLNISSTQSISPAVPFNIYDCQSFTNCGDCVSYPGIQCEWCNSPGLSSCKDSGASTSCPSASLITPDLASQCPNLLSTDPMSLIIGLSTAVDVTLTGEYLNFPDQSSVETNLRCGLTPYNAAGEVASSEVVYTTQFENAESVHCSDVAIPSGAFAMIRLIDTVTGMSAASPINISVVDCAAYSDCPTCLEAGCMLCGGICNGSCSSEDIKQAVCPEFSDVSPKYSELSAQTSVSVKASNLLATFSSATGSLSARSFMRSYDSHADLSLIETRDTIKLELSTLTWKESRTRISHLLKQLESVEYEIQVSLIRSEAASNALLAEIESSNSETGAKAIERRNVAALPTLPYTCSWDEDEVTSAQYSAPDTIICESPTSGRARNVSLTIYLGDALYLNVPQVFELITCPSVDPITTDGTTSCNPECMANQDPLDQRCGWCALSGTCTSPALCPIPADIWQSSCSGIGLSVLGSNYEGGRALNINMSVPLPPYVDTRNLTCSFAGVYTPANVSSIDSQTLEIQSVTCTIPRSPAPEDSTRTVTVPVAVQYNAKSVTSTAAFSYVNCKAFSKCDDCTARPLCGWCSTNKKCTMDYECSSADWSRELCPLNTLAIGLGVGLGLVALILLVGLLVFLLVRAHRRRTGLVIVMEEPNYDAIAWGNDIRMLYRLPKSRWSVLEQALQRPDFVLQLGLSFNCPATEQDALAKGLVYVACAHGLATDMIKTVIRAEVQACSLENQLFRSNSVASKMYKFFSRIVGVKYLYHCIARMVMELEVLGQRAILAAHANTKGKGGHSSGSSLASGDSGSVSILDVSLELDATKNGGGGDDVDAEINRLQLQLICQKILTVLSKKTLRNIPKPLREIFVEIDRSVSAKFPGSNEAIYKGLGGLFFLRFVCPALTAPHVYGLLQAPPNDATQRQLVLIAKVIQSIANMQTQTQKEDYMEKMGSFINKSIPRIQRFYDNLREAANINTATSIYERVVVVPDEVRHNGLAAVQAVLVPQAAKIQAWDSSAVLSEPQHADLTRIVDECLESDDHIPKKSKQV